MSKLARETVFDSELLEERPGFIAVLFSGKGCKQLFSNEAGGHRWQRSSPTEKRGRIHTSTITCAVLNPELEIKFQLDEKDVEIKTTRGSGPGGQARNKIESCVIATHIPTGISVRIDLRSQYQSKTMALKILASKLEEQEALKTSEGKDFVRKNQVGLGMRADKIRTYRYQDDKVTDHRSNKTWSLKSWMRGDW